MNRIAELPLAQYPTQVGVLWRSRHEEPEQEIFKKLPDWMDQEPDRTQDRRDIARLLEVALETITLREAQILRYRFCYELTYVEVGKIYSLTRERIRQIEARALRKMKHPSRLNHLRQYGDLFTGRHRASMDWSLTKDLPVI